MRVLWNLQGRCWASGETLQRDFLATWVSLSVLAPVVSDRFLIAQQTVSEQMAEIFQSTRDGCAPDEDVKRLKILREQYIALSKEVEDVMGRRFV